MAWSRENSNFCWAKNYEDVPDLWKWRARPLVEVMFNRITVTMPSYFIQVFMSFWITETDWLWHFIKTQNLRREFFMIGDRAKDFSLRLLKITCFMIKFQPSTVDDLHQDNRKLNNHKYSKFFQIRQFSILYSCSSSWPIRPSRSILNGIIRKRAEKLCEEIRNMGIFSQKNSNFRKNLSRNSRNIRLLWIWKGWILFC